jgi:hypothetical protein
MKYYTSKEQEKLINEEYYLAIKEKQEEIDEKKRKTGKLQKYKASFYINKPLRVFICEDDQVYMKFGSKKIMCPSEEVKGGGIYLIDSDYVDRFNKFVLENKNYTVEFTLGNGSLGYYGGPNVYPSTIRSINDIYVYEVFEDEDKFDLMCG